MKDTMSVSQGVMERRVILVTWPMAKQRYALQNFHWFSQNFYEPLPFPSPRQKHCTPLKVAFNTFFLHVDTPNEICSEIMYIQNSENIESNMERFHLSIASLQEHCFGLTKTEKLKQKRQDSSLVRSLQNRRDFFMFSRQARSGRFLHLPCRTCLSLHVRFDAKKSRTQPIVVSPCNAPLLLVELLSVLCANKLHLLHLMYN